VPDSPEPFSGSRPPGARIVSFVQRSGRLGPRLQRVWDAHAADYLVEVPRGGPATSIASGYRLDPHALFGRDAPLVVEIGSGRGETIAAAAAERPDVDHLACEVYRPGVARTVARLSQAGTTNVRILQADAVHLLASALPEASVDELWVFFPDPWHKARHHKRRLVSPDLARLVARVLRDGGVWRLATDWPDYADQIAHVLHEAPDLDGGEVDRFSRRPLTRFESKARDEGRATTDFAVTRRPRAARLSTDPLAPR